MLDILFVNAANEPSIRREVNGTMLLASKLLEADFDVDVVRFYQSEHYQKDYAAFLQQMLELIRQQQPRCVSFYSLWPDCHIMLRLAKELKQEDENIITVFGGPQPSATAAEIMAAAPYVDYISTGEGENIVVPLFDAILRSKGDCADIPGLYYRRDGKVGHNDALPPLCDLNTLPLWNPKLIPPQDPQLLTRHYFYMPIDVGRGCPYNCTFCCTSYFWRRNYRLKSPERIVREIRHLHDTYNIHSFCFSHDAFTINRNLVEAVCDRIIEEKLDITWECSTRIDCVTEELLLKMKQAGLSTIQMGVETGSPRMQKLTNKNLDLDRIRRMTKFLMENRIYGVLFFMYGFPEETEEDLHDTLKLVFELMDMGNRYFTMSFCRFTPNTAITDKHMEQLMFDPNANILFHDTFGFWDELELIKNNRAIFPFYFDLVTPVRQNYQYLHFFVEVNGRCFRAGRQLRKLYANNFLQYYRDFYEANKEILEGDITEAGKWFDEHPLEALLNVTALRNDPFRKPLEGLLTYSYRLNEVYEARTDIVIEDTFDFNYADLKLGHPIQEFSPGRTKIRIEKINGKTGIEILEIQWDK